MYLCLIHQANNKQEERIFESIQLFACWLLRGKGGLSASNIYIYIHKLLSLIHYLFRCKLNNQAKQSTPLTMFWLLWFDNNDFHQKVSSSSPNFRWPNERPNNFRFCYIDSQAQIGWKLVSSWGALLYFYWTIKNYIVLYVREIDE